MYCAEPHVGSVKNAGIIEIQGGGGGSGGFAAIYYRVINATFTINGVAQQYEYVYSDDPDAKLEAVSLPNGAVQTLDYDKLSRVHKVELNVADGTLEHREYEYLKVGDHTSNLVSKLKFARDGVQREMLRYKYDEKGNITEIRENNPLLARYKYDGLSRLIREDNKGFAKTTTFSYSNIATTLAEMVIFPRTSKVPLFVFDCWKHKGEIFVFVDGLCQVTYLLHLFS